MPLLRKSDIKRLSEQLLIDLDVKSRVEQVDDVLLVDGKLTYLQFEGDWIPALPLVLVQRDLLPSVVVDMGAVRHVANGADIMRPGILSFPDVNEGDIVSIIDEKNSMPLAIGRMLLNSDQARLSSSGKSVRNLHFVGDEYWKSHK